MAAFSSLGLGKIAVSAPVLGPVRQVATTEHFRVFARTPHEAKPALAEKLLARVSRELGVSVTGTFDYHAYVRGQDTAVAGRPVAGITYQKERRLHAQENVLEHEMVHVVTAGLGDPGSLFQEGLATAVGDHGRWGGEDVDAIAARYLPRVPFTVVARRFRALDPSISYPMSGSFVRWLVRTHGMARVIRLFELCRDLSAETAFPAAFGQTLDEAGEAWTTSLVPPRLEALAR